MHGKASARSSLWLPICTSPSLSAHGCKAWARMVHAENWLLGAFEWPFQATTPVSLLFFSPSRTYLSLSGWSSLKHSDGANNGQKEKLWHITHMDRKASVDTRQKKSLLRHVGRAKRMPQQPSRSQWWSNASHSKGAGRRRFWSNSELQLHRRISYSGPLTHVTPVARKRLHKLLSTSGHTP